MNASTLLEFKVLVERAVRPVQASLFRKQQMRDEMLAHVLEVFEEETQSLGNDAAAQTRTIERFGDPIEVAHQLQASVTMADALDRCVERVWFQPGEPTLRRAVRHALLLDLAVLVFLVAVAAVPFNLFTGFTAAHEVTAGLVSVLLGMFYFVIGFTFLAEWMRHALDAPTERRRGAMLVLAASSLLIPILGAGLSLDFARLNLPELLAVISLGLVIPGAVVHLAKGIGIRMRDHEEWAALPLNSPAASIP